MDKKRGFTLIEVLFTFGILAICICGILLTYLQMLVLTDLSRDLTLVTNAAQAKMEEVKKTDFASIAGSTFDIAGFAPGNAKGVVYVTSDTGYADIKRVRIEVSFKSRNRVIGADQDLDGIRDVGENANAKSELTSPVELVALIACTGDTCPE